MSHFSKLWLTFTLCAEERTSQCSCWRERKSLCFNRWGFLHFFIHNLQRNKWEFYRRASENLKTGYYQVIHIPLTHCQVYCISASPSSSVEARASVGNYRIQHSQWFICYLEPRSGKHSCDKQVNLEVYEEWVCQSTPHSLFPRAKSGSTINRLHYKGNIDFIFATKNR